MRTNGLYSEYGRRDDDGRETQASSFSLGSGRDAGRGDRTVEEKTWFEPLVECTDDFCPIPAISKIDPVDMVNHPPHYAGAGRKFETIDKIEDAVQFAPDAVLGGLQWQALKYLDRLWQKGDPLENASKAQWYLNRLIDKLS
jgi:hypothetical protein